MLAVEAKSLSKVYRFYQKPVHRLLETIFRRPMHAAFNALEDVSFAMPMGKTLGIIGENGAGKSTLLKILAKTLTPSSGQLLIQGRVSALLELGAGFHQEFTGRQNIYLNASLMGLSENEIKAREQEIIDFAELGKFIDRPIRTYSSGMVVRLAFSIATSVDPDILVVDEALSVGDQRFQEKCIERMQGFRKSGKTIIVCSHSMYLINELCAHCIWLEQGRIKEYGRTDTVISAYLAFLERNGEDSKLSNACSNKSFEVVVDNIRPIDETGLEIKSVCQFSMFKVEIQTKCMVRSFMGHIAVALEDQNNLHLFSAITKDSVSKPIKFCETQSIIFSLPNICLQKGHIWIKVIITDQHGLRVVDEKQKGPVTIVSEHPEFGLLWMEHEWIL